MLPITLEPQHQINLFPAHNKCALNYELEVIEKGFMAEVRLYFLTNQKEKTSRRPVKKSTPKYETIFLFKQ